MNWSDQTVLVTGATGFLGAWLCKELVEKKARVVGLARKPDPTLLSFHGIKDRVEWVFADIVNDAQIKKVFEKIKPTYCFHLAGISSPTLCTQKPLDAFYANVVGSSVVFHACAKHQTKVVFASSVRVYKNQKNASEVSPVDTDLPYAFSKLAAEDMLRFLVKQKRLSAVIARLSTVYGPVRLAASQHFVNNNIVTALRRVPNKNRTDYVRDFLFVSDAVNGLVLLSEHCEKFRGHVFNFSSGASFLGTDLAKNIRDLVDQKPTRFKPLPKHQISNRLAFSKLGWKPVFSVEDGLLATIAWYQTGQGRFKEGSYD